MKKIKIAFYGASVTQQSINRDGKIVGYVPNVKKILHEKYSEDSFIFYQFGYGSNHFNDAGYIYFNELLEVSPDIVVLEWHSTGLDNFNAEKYDYVIHKLLDQKCKVISLVLPLKRCINKTERINIQQSRWYQRKDVIQYNVYKLIGQINIDECLRDAVHTNEHGGKVYGSLVADLLIKIINNEEVQKEEGKVIPPTKTYLEAPIVTSIEVNEDLIASQILKIRLSSNNSQPMQLFFKSRVGPFSPLLNISTKIGTHEVHIYDEWCSHERTVLKPLSKILESDISNVSISIAKQLPNNIDEQFLKTPRMLKNIEKIYCVGGNILDIKIKNPFQKQKVLIFANCHGIIYQNALKEIDKDDTLEIEHIISYENMGNFEKIKHKFSECDILIIQPVQNYEKFKINNLRLLLKKDCQVIRVPFFRFNGYWDKNNVRDLTKFSQPAVMFFPNVKTLKDVDQYLDQELDEKDVKSIFEKGLEELKSLEDQGDVKFVDFFLANHQNIPMFRDPYHPTDIVYKYLSNQIVEAVRKNNPTLSKKTFTIPKSWEKEYGHFKPIQNITADVLGLDYDLNSFFKFSRKAYLESIISYENSIKKEIIDDLGKLNKLITLYKSKENSLIEKRNNTEDIVAQHSYIVYDKDWQYPAITEQYAFNKVQELIDIGSNNIYIAFPWATLIDKLNKQGEKASKEMFDVLGKIKQKIPANKNIITVCQHILMLKFENIFIDLGITHVFWTHAVRGQDCFIKKPQIKIYPFPLFPVQAEGVKKLNDEKRSILYSFVGAKSNQWYLTQSRTYIIELLSNDKRGIVVGRDTWHFNNVVYDHQIEKNADSNKELINSKATAEFKDIVQKSIFSLCPSGTGPNSIRLWESIGFGTIPVILADTYLPPGNHKLWEEAVVFCKETPEAIKELPDRLETMAKDSELLNRKRNAMKQLWILYGPESFIYDIEKLFLSLEINSEARQDKQENFKVIMNIILNNPEDLNEVINIFIDGLISRILSDPTVITKWLLEDLEFQDVIKLAFKVGPKEKIDVLKQVMKFRKINLT